MSDLASLPVGERVRVLGGKNFEKFHGGMEGTIVENNPESRNMKIHFDDEATSGSEPVLVAYAHLEHAPDKGGYRHLKKETSKEDNGKAKDTGFLKEHGPFASRQLVRLHSLQGAAELNGRLGRLGNFDPTAERWQVDLRPMGEKGERKMLKEGNLQSPQKPEIPALLSVAELKERGNEHVKKWEYEEAIAFYSKAVELLEDPEISKPPDVMDPKYFAVVLNNRAQCYMNLFRELHGQEGKCGEARSFAMRANLDSAKSIELDPSNGKAYYRRGCAMLGMAPSASRAKEAIWHLEAAFAGRASGGKDGVVLPNAMRHEVSTVLDYAKKRLDDCTEAAVPDVDQCRENCRQQ